jgi:hypothetical protein
MYYDGDYDMYDDTYEDEAIIEAALDIYDEYDVSMEEAIDIAMEKVYRSIGGHEMKKLREKDPNVSIVNSDKYYKEMMKDWTFWKALRNVKNGGKDDPAIQTYFRLKYGGIADPDTSEFFDSARHSYGDYGYNEGKKFNRKIKFKDIDRDNPKPKPTPSAPTPTRSEPTPSAPTPTPIKNPIPTPEPTPTASTPSAPIKRRIDPKTGIAVGAGAAALGAGVALYKYRKKKLAEAAKAQREAEKEEAKAAAKREEAKDAVAQAKEASMYF